ncbi:MAG: hypothetical protein K0R08_1100 [Solimicrobium sp.]|jgi:hypothetical protein|nr:hypothetical protein [Solimicrobium sp.]
MLLPTKSLTVQSTKHFGIQDWNALNENRCGTIVTSENGRRYHVKWNPSGSLKVKRDLSREHFFVVVREIIERGLFTATFASQLEKRLSTLSAQTELENSLRKEIDENIQVINELQITANRIDSTLKFFDYYPHFSTTSQHQRVKKQCIQHCQDISTQYETVRSKEKEILSKQLDTLIKRLETIKNGVELPTNFKILMEEIHIETNRVINDIAKLEQINKEDKTILKLFVTGINLSDSTLVSQYLLARTTMLSETLTTYQKTEEEQQKRASFLTDQHRVARQFMLCRGFEEETNTTQEIKSVLEECGELFTPPNHPDKKINAQMKDMYQNQSSALANFLINHEATWEQIDTEMSNLSIYKTALENQITTRNEIAIFLQDKSQLSDSNNKQNHRRDELILLQTRCDKPGVDIASISMCRTAINHMKALQLGAIISHFLNKNLSGKRGVSVFNNHFYDQQTQARINSLIALEDRCIKQSDELNGFDRDDINKEANEHINAITKWSTDRVRYTDKLIAKFDCISNGYTYQKLKFDQKNALFIRKKEALNKEMGGVLLVNQENLLQLQEKKELLTKLKSKAVNLVAQSEQFKESANKLKKSLATFNRD